MSAPHMEYRWNVRAFLPNGQSEVYVVCEIKARARQTADDLARQRPAILATQVVDNLDELPDDPRVDRAS